jgi:hypothetical protein
MEKGRSFESAEAAAQQRVIMGGAQSGTASDAPGACRPDFCSAGG